MTPTINVFPENPRRRASIQIIPLIDVVFFLLATFVLYTLARERIVNHSITFPNAGERTINAFDQTLYLTSTGPDLYLWKIGRDSAPAAISALELRAFLVNYAQSTPRPRVMLDGDGTAKFSSSIRALDAIKRAQISEYTFDTSGH